MDKTDGCDRESWSAFYVDLFVAHTEAEAQRLAQQELNNWRAVSGTNYGEIEVREANN